MAANLPLKSTQMLYLNNVDDGVTASQGAINTVLSRFYINESLSGAGRAGLDVAAVLVYAGAHDATQRTQMFDYLDTKYL